MKYESRETYPSENVKYTTTPRVEQSRFSGLPVFTYGCIHRRILELSLDRKYIGKNETTFSIILRKFRPDAVWMWHRTARKSGNERKRWKGKFCKEKADPHGKIQNRMVTTVKRVKMAFPERTQRPRREDSR